MEPVEPPTKRRKLDVNLSEDVLAASAQQDSPHHSLDRPISPPLSKRRGDAVGAPDWGFENIPPKESTKTPPVVDAQQDQPQERNSSGLQRRKYVPSPFQLMHIRDLAPSQNVDAVKLKDILGDPMIKECWNFNFLFDTDFVM